MIKITEIFATRRKDTPEPVRSIAQIRTFQTLRGSKKIKQF